MYIIFQQLSEISFMTDSKQEKLLKEFGKKLQKLRVAKKLSIRGFAYAADLSVSYVQKLEAGTSNPSLTTLIKIAEVLEVEWMEFVTRNKS